MRIFLILVFSICGSFASAHELSIDDLHMTAAQKRFLLMATTCQAGGEPTTNVNHEHLDDDNIKLILKAKCTHEQ